MHGMNDVKVIKVAKQELSIFTKTPRRNLLKPMQ
jgi:hypothetical protein